MPPTSLRQKPASHHGLPSGGEAIDVLLVGGGLANSLIALRLKARRPELKVALVEQAQGDPPSRTWSFFRTDVSAAVWSWLRPLAAHGWQGYDVRFPGHERTLATDYASLTSQGLRAAVRAALGGDLRDGVVVDLAHDRATTAGGEALTAPLVIDGRGPRSSAAMSLAWQKFIGLELRTAAPHGVERPVVMDATVEQLDGFRFLYLLPLSADVLLVEDTRYSASPALDPAALKAEIAAYVSGKGWRIETVMREESGVLPVVLGGDIGAFWDEADADVPQAGLRAALFHPTTGYSLPQAARLADLIADCETLTSAAVSILIRRRSKQLWRSGRFFRLLNRMMFLAAEPERRYRVLQRFYRLSPGLIERFYAGELTPADCARLLLGEPPVPLRRALAALPERAAYPRSVHA